MSDRPSTTDPSVSNHPASPPRHGRPAVSARAIGLGLLLIPLNAYFIVRQERVLFGPYVSTISLFANVIFFLFVLRGLNAGLRRLAPRAVFSQGEMITLYTMLGISTGLAGLDGVGILAQIMPHGAWFGETNGWSRFLKDFPDWLVVRDRMALRGHFMGNSSFYRPEVLRAWATPILAWTCFMTALLWVANCMNVLVRRQWADHERLTFPITWLPLEMTDSRPDAPFFRSWLMWGGFSLAAGLSLWNGLSFLYPQIPMLPIGITDLKPMMTTKPWNAIDWFPVTAYPLAIGLGFLLPVDLLFSCWFFFLLWKGQIVVSSAMAWDATPDFPFIKEQGFGSIMGLFLFYLYSGRKTYAAIWRSAVSRASAGASMGEALSDRGALLGLGGGVLALLLFCRAAGVAWWAAGAFFAIYLATIAVVTRIRAELGPPIHDFHFMGPDAMICRAASASVLRPADMAFFTFTFSLTRAHRGDTMPVGLEGLQMAHSRGMEARRMLVAIMLAAAIGTLSAFWAIEHQAYAVGAAAKFHQGILQGQEAFDRTSRWTAGTLDMRPNVQATTAMGTGLLTTLVLFALRLRWFGFPLHPIGYAISSSWAIHLVWLPLLIAWGLKWLTMHYGGLNAYRRFLPFFLGMVLGDCVMGTVWALLSALMGVPTYTFFGA